MATLDRKSMFNCLFLAVSMYPQAIKTHCRALHAFDFRYHLLKNGKIGNMPDNTGPTDNTITEDKNPSGTAKSEVITPENSKKTYEQLIKTDKQKEYFHAKTPPEVEDEVLKMVANGLTYRKIVEQTGGKITIGTISQIVKRLGKRSEERKEKYLRAIDRMGAKDVRRAKKLVDLLEATKLTKFGDTPDNKVQLETVKYIDSLKSYVEEHSGRAIGVRGENIEVVIKDY